jgi:hypothetical protein
MPPIIFELVWLWLEDEVVPIEVDWESGDSDMEVADVVVVCSVSTLLVRVLSVVVVGLVSVVDDAVVFVVLVVFVLVFDVAVAVTVVTDIVSLVFSGSVESDLSPFESGHPEPQGSTEQQPRNPPEQTYHSVLGAHAVS